MRHRPILAALLLVGEAFRPPTPRKRSLRLSARPQPTQQRWSDRRTNQAVVSKWRRSPEPEIVYEVDRKCVAKHLPRGADAAYLRDVLSDAFGPLASVEVAPGDVAYVVFERREDAAAAAKTSVRVRSGDMERTLDCEAYAPRRDAPRGASTHLVVGNVPYACGDDLLRRVFADAGCPPLQLRRPKDGVAFLDFKNHETAARAARLHGTRVLGRALRVDWDVVPEAPRPRDRAPRNATSLASHRPPRAPKRAAPKAADPPSVKKRPAAPRRGASAEARVGAALAHAETARDLAEASGETVARAAAAAAAAAWQEADALRTENRRLRSRLPRRATWQPAPFEVVLGPGARPRDVVRARVDNERDVEIVVPDGAGAGCVLRVRGALRCEVPRGAYVGAPVAVPLPDAESQLRVVVAVPPGRGPGDAVYVAWPVDVVSVPGDRSLLPPPAVALPPPLSDDPPRLAPPAAHQALVAATPDPLLDEAAALRDENADLRRQLLAMRRLLRTTSELFLASQASATDELPLALDEPEEDSA